MYGSYVSQMFLFQLRCSNCGHSSDTYEPLIDLSLEIEDVITIQRALESFTMVEKIDEKVTCDSCGEDVFMEKQFMLNQPPQIVALHLKRFKKDENSIRKIDNHVYFTMELDLQPYTSGNPNDNVSCDLIYIPPFYIFLVLGMWALLEYSCLSM